MKQNGVIIALLIGFLVFFLVSHQNYMDLLEVNDELLLTLDDSRESADRRVEICNYEYGELERRYCELLDENEKLAAENSELKKQVEKLKGRKRIPTYTLTAEEVELLALVAQCEAGEGNEASQRNVVSVVLNRVEADEFPDTISEVVYQKEGGTPQFSVAWNGAIERAVATDEALVNVYRVLFLGRTLPEDVLYFYSARLAECSWIRTLPVYDEIEGTVFAYEKGAKQ